MNAKAPDFKHKDTGEALWLNDSPAWVLSKLPPLRSKDGVIGWRDTLLSWDLNRMGVRRWSAGMHFSAQLQLFVIEEQKDLRKLSPFRQWDSLMVYNSCCTWKMVRKDNVTISNYPAILAFISFITFGYQTILIWTCTIILPDMVRRWYLVPFDSTHDSTF
jgi:hypothetical protein